MPNDGLHSIQAFGNETSGTMYESDVRYFSVRSINIVTPENITYRDPMSGYYPATYGFEDTADGTFPVGWIDKSMAGCSVQVISDLDGHNKVAQLDDSTSSHNLASMNETINIQPNGTIEYWYRVSRVDSRNTGNLRMYDISDSDGLVFGSYNNQFFYYDGSHHYFGSCSANTWYHVRIDFESTGGGYMGLSMDQFYAWVNGIQYGPYPYRGGNNGMSNIIFDTWEMPSGTYYNLLY